MRTLILFIAALTLVGCATGPISLPVKNLALSEQTTVEDLRPKSEGTQNIFSSLIFSEQYGYIRIAENVTEPSSTRLFSHRLQQKYSEKPVPNTKLHHFVVYANQRAEFTSFALGVGVGGVVGAVLAGSTVKREGDAVHTLVDSESFSKLSGENEYKRALYTEAELKAGTSAFIVFIESESEGIKRFTRSVVAIKPTKAEEKIPLHQALDVAIDFHLNP